MERLIALVQESNYQAPEWIRILSMGKMVLDDGREPISVTPEAVAAVVAAWRRRGIDLVMDYEHQTLTGERAPAAGWVKELEARDDGLWARVEWTQQAKEYLKNREYRYFSPVLRLDPKTREPLALLHLALTNTPALRNLEPLAAKLEALSAQDKAAQEARAKKYGIGVKEGGNVTKPGQWAQVPDGQFADPVNYRYPMPDHDQTKAAWSYWNKAKNQEQYTPEERAKITQRIKARAKEVGMQISGEEAAQAMKDKLIKLLALKTEATEEEILATTEKKLGAVAGIPEIAQALGLEEAATTAQIKGAVLALKQGSDRLAQVQTELTALKTALASRDAEKAVEEALKAGKIQPSQRDWALDYAAKDPEGFKTYVDKALKVVPVGDALKILPEAGKAGGLTPEETLICKQMGLKPEAFKAEKEKQAAA